MLSQSWRKTEETGFSNINWHCPYCIYIYLTQECWRLTPRTNSKNRPKDECGKRGLVAAAVRKETCNQFRWWTGRRWSLQSESIQGIRVYLTKVGPKSWMHGLRMLSTICSYRFKHAQQTRSSIFTLSHITSSVRQWGYNWYHIQPPRVTGLSFE